jgi:tripartite ATP-independent transporter DctP family solute receptor
MRGRTIVTALGGLMAALALGAAAHADTVIKFAHVDPEDWTTSKKGAAGKVFKDMVEAESGGAIKVELYPAAQLGGEKDIIPQAQAGAVQMTMVSGAFSSFCKEAGIFDTPYLFSSAPVAWKVLDGDFGKKVADQCLKETGLRTLAYGETGFRDFTNNVRAIKSPADVAGLKLRVQEIPLYVEMVKGRGGVPTPVAWPETPGALKTGVVDGQENPVSVILASKFYEMQKYLTLDQHVYGTDFILINDAFFKGLPPEQQGILQRAAIVAGLAGRAIQQIKSAAGVAELQKNGMQVYKPSADEMAQFRDKAQTPVLAYLKTQVDQQWLDDLQAAVKQAEGSLAAQ